MASTPSPSERLSPSQLAELLARAQDEQWSLLALVGPDTYPDYEAKVIRDGWPAAHIVRLSATLKDDGVRALASLTSLTSLYLGWNSVGDDGVRALLEALIDAPMADRIQVLDMGRILSLSDLLPKEVIDSKDAQAILAAYRRYREAQRQQTLATAQRSQVAGRWE